MLAPEQSEQLNQAHRELVQRLKKDDHDIYVSLKPGDCDLLHMTLGALTDVGELGTAIKAMVFYRKPQDRANVVEELGDIEFFLEGLRSRLGVTRDETLLANIDKLNKRYAAGGYSDKEAQERKDKR